MGERTQGSIRGSRGHQWLNRGSGSHPEAEAKQRGNTHSTCQLRRRGSERTEKESWGGGGVTEGEWAKEPSSKGGDVQGQLGGDHGHRLAQGGDQLADPKRSSSGGMGDGK